MLLKMKSSEDCLLEILTMLSLKNGVKLEKDNVKVFKTPDSWSKLRNFDNNYTFSGDINLEKDCILYFFFSNSRSCLSIESSKYKLMELNLISDLFDRYHIDEFINNYIKKLY